MEFYFGEVSHIGLGNGYDCLCNCNFTITRNWGHAAISAESPGPNTDKLHPRITDTAKRLWLIYVSFTFIETIFLKLAGMSFLMLSTTR